MPTRRSYKGEGQNTEQVQGAGIRFGGIFSPRTSDVPYWLLPKNSTKKKQLDRASTFGAGPSSPYLMYSTPANIGAGSVRGELSPVQIWRNTPDLKPSEAVMRLLPPPSTSSSQEVNGLPLTPTWYGASGRGKPAFINPIMVADRMLRDVVNQKATLKDVVDVLEGALSGQGKAGTNVTTDVQRTVRTRTPLTPSVKAVTSPEYGLRVIQDYDKKRNTAPVYRPAEPKSKQL